MRSPGVDIALWDIAGKVAGTAALPVVRRSEAHALPAYASLLRCTGPEAVAAELPPRPSTQGFRQIKLHEITLPAVKAAREAVGPDVLLMLDTNCPWSLREALRDGRSAAAL